MQGYDRYAYANNDPILYSDPSGHCFTGAVIDTILCGAIVGGLVGGGASYARQVASNIRDNGGWSVSAFTQNIDMQEIGTSALVGVAAGAAIASGGLLAAVGTGAAMSAAGYSAAATINNDYDTRAMVTNAGIGGLAALATGGMAPYLKGPVPLQGAGILSDSLMPAVKMLFNSGVNGVASQLQTLATNAWTGTPTTGSGMAWSFTTGFMSGSFGEIMVPGTMQGFRAGVTELLGRGLDTSRPRQDKESYPTGSLATAY